MIDYKKRGSLENGTIGFKSCLNERIGQEIQSHPLLFIKLLVIFKKYHRLKMKNLAKEKKFLRIVGKLIWKSLNFKLTYKFQISENLFLFSWYISLNIIIKGFQNILQSSTKYII